MKRLFIFKLTLFFSYNVAHVKQFDVWLYNALTKIFYSLANLRLYYIESKFLMPNFFSLLAKDINSASPRVQLNAQMRFITW